MRVFLNAAAAAALFVSSAYAQPAEAPSPTTSVSSATATSSRCPELAADPSLPDGATATADQVTLAESVYQAWAEASRATIACRRAEYEELVELATRRRDDHNAAAARVNTVTNAWVAEREEYCARPRTRCQAPAE